MPEEIDINEAEDQDLETAWDKLEEGATSTFSDADKERATAMLLDRHKTLQSAEQADWYDALLSIAIDEMNGDIFKAIAEADKAFISQPRPPKEPVQ